MEDSRVSLNEAAGNSPDSNATTTSTWSYEAQISEMTIERSAEKFNRISGIQHQSTSEILMLSKILQFHPVPVEMAIGFIKNQLPDNPTPIRTYLGYLLTENSVFPAVGMTDIEKSIFKTWILTLQTVVPGTDEHDYISTLLSTIAAFFEPDNIHVCLFEDSEVFPDPVQLTAKVDLLKKYSIVSGPAGIICLHPLLQRVIRLTLSSTCQANVIDILKIGLGMLKPFLAADSEASLWTLHMALHAKSIWKYAMRYDSVVREFACIPTYICRKLNVNSKHAEQIEVARDAASWFTRVCGSSYFGAILMKYYHGQGLFALKKYSESLEILNAIRPVAMTKLGLDSSVTLMILETIAENFRAQERYSSQLEVLELVVVGRANMDGPEHMTTLAALFNQSITLAHLNRSDEALEIAQRVHQICKRIRGENDFWTWVTKNWIIVLRFTS